MKKLGVILLICFVSSLSYSLNYRNLPLKSIEEEEKVVTTSGALEEKTIDQEIKKPEQTKFQVETETSKTTRAVKKQPQQQVKLQEKKEIETKTENQKENQKENQTENKFLKEGNLPKELLKEKEIEDKKLIYDYGKLLEIKTEKEIHNKLVNFFNETGIKTFYVTNSDENYYNVKESVLKYFSNSKEKVIVFERNKTDLSIYYVGELTNNTKIKNYILKNIIKVLAKQDLTSYKEEINKMLDLLYLNKDNILKLSKEKIELEKNKSYKSLYNLIIIVVIFLILYFTIMKLPVILEKGVEK